MENRLEVANQLFEEKMFTDAEMIFQKIYAQEQNTEALFGLVLCAYQKEDYARSLNYIDTLLTLDPDHGGAFNQAGVIAYTMEDWESAKALFKAAMEKAPDSITAQRNYAEVLLKVGDYANGISVLMKILENHVDDIPTLLRLAQLNAEANRKEDAAAWAKKVLAHDPLNEEAKEFLNNFKD